MFNCRHPHHPPLVQALLKGQRILPKAPSAGGSHRRRRCSAVYLAPPGPREHKGCVERGKVRRFHPDPDYHPRSRPAPEQLPLRPVRWRAARSRPVPFPPLAPRARASRLSGWGSFGSRTVHAVIDAPAPRGIMSLDASPSKRAPAHRQPCLSSGEGPEDGDHLGCRNTSAHFGSYAAMTWIAQDYRVTA